MSEKYTSLRSTIPQTVRVICLLILSLASPLSLFAQNLSANNSEEGRPEIKKINQLIGETQQCLENGQWEKQVEQLEKELLPLLNETFATNGLQRYQKIWANPILATALSQTYFIRQVTPDELRRLSYKKTYNPFLSELLKNSEWMANFALNLKAEDKTQEALEVWASLWADDSKELKGKYFNLQIACALVFDVPPLYLHIGTNKPFEISVLNRYRLFRELAEGNKLLTDIKTLQPYELIWVVASAVPDEELRWAQSQNNLRNLADWAPAYPMIKYRMDFVTKEKTNLPPPIESTLKEILEIGGICVQQGHFAASTANAFGIPATTVTGEGNRGGHLWFAYMRKDRSWNMNAGRYNDGYACGSVRNPQTNKTIGEFEVEILGDAQRTSDRFKKSQQLLITANVYKQNQNLKAEKETLWLSIQAANRHLEAWRAYAERLEATKTKTKPEEWKSFVTEMRRAFDEWPDMRDLADEMEEKYLFTSMNNEEIFMTCKRAYNRLIADKKRKGAYDRTRYDMIEKAVARNAAVLQKNPKENMDRIHALYRDALDEIVDNLPTFKQILSQYYDAVKNDPKAVAQFLGEIDRLYKRRIGTSGDLFRQRAVLETLKFINEYFIQCKDNLRSKNIEVEIAKLTKSIEGLK
jgi:hypothetical protein